MKNNLIPVLLMSGIIFISCSNTADKTDEAIPDQTAQAVGVENTPTVADQLPAFKLMAADGSRLNLADLKGKKVFINLWATWCPPCKAEIPSIEKLYSKVEKENTVFIMLSLDENFETAKNFAKNNKMTMPVYYPAENLPAMLNTQGIPATFIFNEKGELTKRNDGMDDYDTEAYVRLLKP